MICRVRHEAGVSPLAAVGQDTSVGRTGARVEE
jgi:hypothetical protein